MSPTSPEAASHSNYQVIFDSALEVYKRKTGKDLTSHPLLGSFETCQSPDAILAVFHAQIFGPGQAQSIGDKLLTQLNPTINVLNAFSVTIGGVVGPAYPPAGIIFTGIGILLSAASAVGASRDLLLGLFERIENIFRRLEIYVDVPRTSGMTDVIVKVMVEVLSILAIATKEINQRRTKMFLKKLAGRTDIEDALRRLEEVTLEEARMAAAEALKAIHGVGSNVQDTLKAVEDRMRDMQGVLQGVGDRLQGVDDRVKNMSDKAINSGEKTGIQMPNDSDTVAAEGLKNTQGIDDEVIGSRVIDSAETISASNPLDSTQDNLRQNSKKWLSPPNPTINYGISRDTHHKDTSVWFTESSTFRDWKESGSLLWICGKPGSGKTVLTSVIIEHISNTGLAHMAYFFFDFKDTAKQDSRSFLSSVLIQLSSQSDSFCNILLEFYLTHQRGSKQPTDSALLRCLEKMLKVPVNVPIYLIIDGVDECPNTSGVQSPRAKVLKLLVKLVGFQLSSLRLCVTSRSEADTRNVLEPLTSTSSRISLHDEDGQKKDIADYVSSVVYSDTKTMKWQEEDKKLVIRALSDRNGGVFRWASCQIEVLRRCLTPNVPHVVEELPESLDETYERILHEIPTVNKAHVHRLLQCLTVAIRPLRVEELTEILAIDVSAAEGTTKPNEDWQWKDQGQAVLDACSSLIVVIDDGDSQMIHFSHCSVMEFLTSDRLSTSEVDALRYHIICPEPAHTIMAQACIRVLLRLEYPIDAEYQKGFPLADYAAKHFADHAEFGDVISHIADGIDELVDEDKPHFAAWMSLLNSSSLAEKPSGLKASPLNDLKGLGYHGLARHLISKRGQEKVSRTGVRGLSMDAAHQKPKPQPSLPRSINMDIRNSDGQTPLHVAARNAHVEAARMVIRQGADINARDNNEWTPLQEATFRGHFDVAGLLLEHGANVNVWNKAGWTPLHEASCYGYLEILRLLLEHGASLDTANNDRNTPLHLATQRGQLGAAQLLVEHGADVHVRNSITWTPLHEASFHGRFEILQLLLEHGASTQVQNQGGWTPLHEASCYGYLDILRVLMEHGADLDATNNERNTPLHLATQKGQLSAARQLVERGANVHKENHVNWTPLHEASYHGRFDIFQLLLEHGARVNVRNHGGWTPLHEAACYGYLDILRLLLKNDANLDATNDERSTPLHLAADKGQLGAALLLVEHGANIHVQNCYSFTPLHGASFRGHFDVLKFLLERGASVNVRNNGGWTPLHEAACYGYLDILRLLVEHGANLDATNNERNTPLHLAVQRGQLGAVRLLVERGANVHVENHVNWTPFHEASFHRHFDILQFLMEHGASIHVRNKGGWTPIHEAACYGYLDILRFLLKHGADVDASNNDHNTPLHLAVQKGQLVAAQLLVEHGANVHVENHVKWTPLHEASFHGRIDLLKFLMAHGASIRVRNKDDWTPLHEAACYGYLDILRLLMEHGADLDAANNDRNTPLHLAAQKGQLGAARLLVEHGANVHVENHVNWTPLHVASFHGRLDMLKLLLEHGASIHVQNKGGWTPLHEAACYEYLDILRLLLEHGADLDALNNERNTPLHLAVQRGKIGAARLLVENGADVHVRNNVSWTPLHEASFHGHFDILRLLLEHGASIQVQNQVGWTPLHEASFYGYLDILRFLLEHDADTEAANNDGNTPLHLAAHKGRLDVARLLVEHGANVHVQNKGGCTPLHEASFGGHSDVMMYILEQAANGGPG